MEIFGLIFLIAIVAAIISQIAFGLRLMKTKEYDGRRSISLFRTEENRVTGDAAYSMGLMYALGCSIILMAFVISIPVALLISRETAGMCFGILLLTAF